MDNEEMIAADLFCVSHNIEVSFLHSLCSSGLLEVTTIENAVFISQDQLPDLEKLVRWHYDMDINLEGLETISHLLRQIKEMQQEMQDLKSRLGLYEKIDRP
ncbi:chaperone modulator CbpM [Terrimonas pollutisoli]|uniref:chaperone modulator CbpM n=1 Tax=Terrimonas pollutisoli TaxID=3034147 RepID=UPI0023ED28AA|nr:chaperone modulator CbpM [Terrimonas sp. H1YJ31]